MMKWRIESRSSLHQNWWAWMNHKATVSKSQLRYLAKAGEPLKLSQVKILLLFRSAVVDDMPVERFLCLLRIKNRKRLMELGLEL